MVLSAATAALADGPEFSPLEKPQPTETPGKIEVIEFFWYGCPHCNQLEPLLNAWEKRLPKDVVLRREHVIWPGRRETEVHARLYLTLRAMNLLEIVVNGKYMTSLGTAHGPDKLFGVLDKLIAGERPKKK